MLVTINGLFLKRRPKNKDLRVTDLKRRSSDLKRRLSDLKRSPTDLRRKQRAYDWSVVFWNCRSGGTAGTAGTVEQL